jgi:hypothetical protein
VAQKGMVEECTERSIGAEKEEMKNKDQIMEKNSHVA